MNISSTRGNGLELILRLWPLSRLELDNREGLDVVERIKTHNLTRTLVYAKRCMMISSGKFHALKKTALGQSDGSSSMSLSRRFLQVFA